MKNYGIENTGSQIGSLFGGMAAIFLPKAELRMFFQDGEPGGPNRRDRHFQLLSDAHIPRIDLSLHVFIIIHPVFRHSVSVCPGDKENRCSTDVLYLLNQLARRRIHFLVSDWLDGW